MTRIRSFIAIPLPENLRRELTVVQRELRQAVPELRLVTPANLHLTLNFLGEQSEEQLAKIGRIMLSVGRSRAPFFLTLKGLGTFPGRRRPRVVWLGVQAPEALVELQQALTANLTTLGVPAEQSPYRPHLTLGRFRRPPADPAALDPWREIACEPLPVTSVVLFGSRLTPRGAVHTPLAVAQLNTSVTY